MLHIDIKNLNKKVKIKVNFNHLQRGGINVFINRSKCLLCYLLHGCALSSPAIEMCEIALEISEALNFDQNK